MRRAIPLALRHPHEPSVIVRDGDEVVCMCDRCSALGYADATDDVIGGEPFEDECPNDEPPALTNLASMYAGRPREA
jgi:hypothetical protein